MHHHSFISLLIVAVMGLFLGLPWYLSAADPERTTPPDPIEFVGESSFDIGEVPPYGITNLVFKLRNTGDETVRLIGMFSSCPCIKCSAPTNVIPAKGEIEITARLYLSQVNGKFNRIAHVRFDHPSATMKKLAIAGNVYELFKDIPKKIMEISDLAIGTTVTNTLVLTALKPGLALGHPSVNMSPNIKVTSHIVTNESDSVTSFKVVNIFEATGEVRNRSLVMVSLPVTGVPAEANPITLHYRIQGTAGLVAIPATIELGKNIAEEQNFYIMLRSRGQTLKSENLKWNTLPDGVSVTCTQTGKNRGAIRLSIAVTPQAAAEILKHDGAHPAIHLDYPGCGTAAIEFKRATE